MKKKQISAVNWILILGGILLTVMVLSLSAGSADIGLSKIISLIAEKQDNTTLSIITQIRLPRIILALFVGSALSVAGVILQGIFHNPLVEPYTLGVSGGAALGVAIVIALGLRIFIPLAGFIGALLCIGILYLIAARQKNLGMPSLLLAGIMISFIASSSVMLIMACANTEGLHSIVFWIMGSLEEPNWALIKLVSAVIGIGIIISLFFFKDLNALGLGEEEAAHLGINVKRSRKILFILASLLTGCSVSIAGIIGFVGLVVPHFMRMLVGRDHRILIISSAIGGGAFLILCDTAARTIISPLELPVGVITGIIGGILFIYFLIKTR